MQKQEKKICAGGVQNRTLQSGGDQSDPVCGDVIGAVLLLNMDQKDLFEEREICLAEYTAKVLGKQMEQ